ncbi:MAG: hypothetical protein V6Z81_10235 [Parvularculales bacterium]
MDDDECKAFEAISGFEKIILVRHCDDQGKVQCMEVPPLESYLPILYRIADGLRQMGFALDHYCRIA